MAIVRAISLGDPMHFIDTWHPLIVLVQENDSDLDQMISGFSRLFERRQPFAVLSTALNRCESADALARTRLATWLNTPTFRSSSSQWCLAWALVTARPWERRAMTALSWQWTPATAHRSVASVTEGLGYCLDCLVKSGPTLEPARQKIHTDVLRTLDRLSVAGLEAMESRPSGAPSRSSLRVKGTKLETLTDEEGRIVLGWLADGVLWARFEGRLSESLARSYARRLAHLLRATERVRYFMFPLTSADGIRPVPAHVA